MENENPTEEIQQPETTQEQQPEAVVEQEQPQEGQEEGKSKEERERDAKGYEERQKRKEREMAIKQAVLDEQEKSLERERLKQSQSQPQSQPQHTHKISGDPATYGYVFDPNNPPIQDKFLDEETYEIDQVAFVRALTDYNQKMTQMTIREEQKRADESQKINTITENISKKEAEYLAANPNSDYLQVIDSASPLLKTLNKDVITAIFDCENPCDVMYKVSSDPKLISKLKDSNPIQIGMELSRLQNSVKTANKVVSNASEPPANPKATVSSSGKQKTDMSDKEYYAQRRRELGMTT
jgi:hypothetical protein